MKSSLLKKFSFKEIKRRYLILEGISSRHCAYKGPDVVQIDLTDRCNSRCLLCWIHTPYKENNKNTNSDELDLSALKNFINDIIKSGTKEIIFSGGGEPFLYPQIWEILEFVQKKGLIFRINTNFTLLNKEDINRLLSFDNLATLVISIWTGDASLYSQLHNRDIGLFDKIKNNLKFLNLSKPSALHVRLFAVVNKMNYCGLGSLIDLASETGCDAIEFGVPDVIPGATDSLLLHESQLKFLRQDFINIIKDCSNKDYVAKIFNKNIFLRRISNQMAYCGEYDSFVDKIPCYAGWLFLRLRANGDLNSCLKSHRIPIGNIYEDSFFSAWNNSLQQEFRRRSLDIHKNKDYFRFIGNGNNGDIGCKRICDNILVNEHLHKILKIFFKI
jgi:MoaA/NifB/PqqE/SkfB family radical SAM enzyme